MDARLRPLLLVLAAILALPTPAAVAQQATPSEEAALQAYREGAFTRAVQLYTTALSETQDPEHRARLHINIAWTLFALGREGDVETHLRAALLEHPSLTLVPDYYTQEFLDRFEAVKTHRPAPEGPSPSGTPSPDLEVTLATVQQRLEDGTDLEGALADIDRLLAGYPEDGRLIPYRIQLLEKLGRDDEAEQLRRVYGGEIGPETMVDRLSIPDLILRANRLLEEGDVATSLELLREAVARQPSNVAALELMAEAAQRAAQWQEAEFALKSALGLQPDNIGLKLRLGEVYLARDQPSAARDVFREVTVDYPHSDRAWAALGLLEALLGNEDRGLEHLDRALAENPLLPEVQLARGELLLAAGDATAALQAFRSADNLLHDDAQLQARTGQALLALGRDEEALTALREGVSGGFAVSDVQRALALAMIRNGLLSEAERVLDGLQRDSAGDAEILQAMLLLEKGELDRAEAILRPVAERRAGDAAVLNLLAVAVHEQGRYPEALSLAERAVELEPESAALQTNRDRVAAARDAEELAADAAPVRVPTR